MQANKLSLSTTPLIAMALGGMAQFALNLVMGQPINWDAIQVSVLCYGFMMIQTNQLNIHSIENPDKFNQRFAGSNPVRSTQKG